MASRNLRRKLISIYKILREEFGHQDWWPANSRFEVIVGAILTQNTAWTNVEKAIKNLKHARLLNPGSLKKVSLPRLANLIRPAGYFNIKAKRLKHFVHFLNESANGNLNRLFREPLSRLRPRLLEVNGVGPETADSILLYAAKKPVFVVDAYTRRFLTRHRYISEKASYDDMQAFFMKNLPHDVELFKDYHAQIVELAKNYCRKIPRCADCPLGDIRPQ